MIFCVCPITFATQKSDHNLLPSLCELMCDLVSSLLLRIAKLMQKHTSRCATSCDFCTTIAISPQKRRNQDHTKLRARQQDIVLSIRIAVWYVRSVATSTACVSRAIATVLSDLTRQVESTATKCFQVQKGKSANVFFLIIRSHLVAVTTEHSRS